MTANRDVIDYLTEKSPVPGSTSRHQQQLSRNSTALQQLVSNSNFGERENARDSDVQRPIGNSAKHFPCAPKQLFARRRVVVERRSGEEQRTIAGRTVVTGELTDVEGRHNTTGLSKHNQRAPRATPTSSAQRSRVQLNHRQHRRHDRRSAAVPLQRTRRRDRRLQNLAHFWSILVSIRSRRASSCARPSARFVTSARVGMLNWVNTWAMADSRVC